MDGTLTVPVHDFEHIRRELGVPAGANILDHLDAQPADEAAHVLDHRALEHGLELVLQRALARGPAVEPVLGDPPRVAAGGGLGGGRVGLGLQQRPDHQLGLAVAGGHLLGEGRQDTGQANPADGKTRKTDPDEG